VIFALLVLSVAAAGCPLPQSSAPQASGSSQELPRESSAPLSQLSEIKKLYDEEKWEEVLRVAPATMGAPAEMDLYRGLALAKLQRWDEARAALAAGERKAPSDERFHLELAGVAFKEKDFRGAERELQRALRFAPHDSYALNFLATTYFLRGNLGAALEYWNRERLPHVGQIKTSPEPQLRPELFDRAFAFAPLSTLDRREFETTRARLDNLGIFSLYRWELVPSADTGADSGAGSTPASFDVTFYSVERDGFGSNKWAAALSILRGLPYETVYPEYDNAFHDAVNFDSLLRFDSEKERVYAEVSTPVQRRPRWRASAWVDGRNERWNISGTFFGASTPISDLKLRKIEAGAGFRSVQSGRWSWETRVAFARRDFTVERGESPSALGLGAAAFFTDGNSLDLSGRTDYRLLSIPRDRITVDSSANAAIGKFFAAPLGNYGRAGGSIAFRWLPKEQGDDYETRSRLRAGGTFGTVPFDELFTLGVERDDNDLWLRGISATRGGRKGNSPMGRDYVLWNSEFDKIVYDGAFFQVRVGPLFDAARIWDASGLFGSQGWLWDSGAQVKVRVLDTFEVVFSYGHDMRSGQNTFFGGTERF
jgi:tetratricopeptide (TPR) repeat protein